MELTSEIKTMLRFLGADISGVASLKNKHEEIEAYFGKQYQAYDYAVSFGVFLPHSVVAEILRGPTPTYAYYYQKVNDLIDLIALRVNGFLEGRSYQTFPIPASQIVGEGMDRSIFSHRLAAKEAGLGWIGKSCSLVNEQAGPRLRLGTILTNAPLVAGAPVKDRCGNCQKCTEICPAGAIKGTAYADGQSRDERLDFDKCNQCLIENEEKYGYYICGQCIAVCPWGLRKNKSKLPEGGGS